MSRKGLIELLKAQIGNPVEITVKDVCYDYILNEVGKDYLIGYVYLINRETDKIVRVKKIVPISKIDMIGLESPEFVELRKRQLTYTLESSAESQNKKEVENTI